MTTMLATPVVSAHGGTVAAALNEPQGLRITVTLPASGRHQRRPAGT
jgi:K+-sensing histidine kinase KdpD